MYIYICIYIYFSQVAHLCIIDISLHADVCMWREFIINYMCIIMQLVIMCIDPFAQFNIYYLAIRYCSSVTLVHAAKPYKMLTVGELRTKMGRTSLIEVNTIHILL